MGALLFLRALWESLGHCCEWVITFLLFPLLVAIFVALPISMLAACIFYDSELPMRILLGVCATFLAVSVPIAVGTWAVLAMLFIKSACRRIGRLLQLVIRLFTEVAASARRKARPSPGEATLWDQWLDGV